jgi:hypothetical protein
MQKERKKGTIYVWLTGVIGREGDWYTWLIKEIQTQKERKTMNNLSMID